MKFSASFWKKSGLFLTSVALLAQLSACTVNVQLPASDKGENSTASDTAARGEAESPAAAEDPQAGQQTPEERASETPADAPENAAGDADEDLTKIDAAAVVVTTDVEDGYFDEVCSYRLEMPDVEDDDNAALEAIDDFFDTLEESLERYCGTTVYDEAQMRGTVADVTGTYQAAQAGAKLTVVYTLKVTYADQADAAEEFERTVAFDVRSGQIVEDSAS